jgi:hypothetical protein
MRCVGIATARDCQLNCLFIAAYAFLRCRNKNEKKFNKPKTIAMVFSVESNGTVRSLGKGEFSPAAWCMSAFPRLRRSAFSFQANPLSFRQICLSRSHLANPHSKLWGLAPVEATIGAFCLQC